MLVLTVFCARTISGQPSKSGGPPKYAEYAKYAGSTKLTRNPLFTANPSETLQPYFFSVQRKTSSKVEQSNPIETLKMILQECTSTALTRHLSTAGKAASQGHVLSDARNLSFRTSKLGSRPFWTSDHSIEDTRVRRPRVRIS